MAEKSEKQAAAVRAKRNLELAKVYERSPGFSCQGLVGSFFDFYVRGEVFASKLQNYYRTDSNKPPLDKLQITALRAALSGFSIAFPKSELDRLFLGGEGKRGRKSARQLRNGYVHTLSINDRYEIQQKAVDFIASLERFLSLRLES